MRGGRELSGKFRGGIRFDLPTVFTLIVVAVLVFAAIDQLIMQWTFRLHFPYRDTVTWTLALDQNPHPTLKSLYMMINYNEHRIILPALFYLLDRNYFHGSGDFLYISIFSCVALIILSIVLPMSVLKAKFGWSAIALFGASVLYWFLGAFNYENLSWEIQICEMACLLLLTGGLTFAVLISKPSDVVDHKWRDLLFAGLAGICIFGATYSYGYGLAGWPIAIGYGLAVRWRLAPLILLSAFAVLAVGLYAYYFAVIADFSHATYHASMGESIGHPIRMVMFITNVMSWPFVQAFENFIWFRPLRWLLMILTVLVCSGAIARLAWIYLFPWLRFRKPAAPSGPVSIATIWIILGFGVAVLIACSRSQWSSGYGESRYAPASAIFWCGLIALLIAELPVKWARRTLFIFASMTAVMAWVPAAKWERILAVRDQEMFQAGSMATFGLDLSPGLPALSARDPELAPLWNSHRPSGPSYGQREPFKWLMNESFSAVAVSPRPCVGAIESAEVVHDNPRIVRLIGWAASAQADDPLRWLVVASNGRRGVGAGKPGLPSTHGYRSGFSMLVRADLHEDLSLWGVRSRGEACRISSIGTSGSPPSPG